MLNADERNERWLKVSIGLLRFEEHMMPLVQQLGRLDVRLIQADETWPDRFFQENLSYDEGTALHEHITLSHLWVLGRTNSSAPSVFALRRILMKRHRRRSATFLSRQSGALRASACLWPKWRRCPNTQARTPQLPIPA